MALQCVISHNDKRLTGSLSALQSDLVYIYNSIRQLIDKAFIIDTSHLQNHISPLN